MDATVKSVPLRHTSHLVHLISDHNSRQYGKINHIVNNGQYSSQRSPLRYLTRDTAGFTFDKMIHTMPDETFDVIMKIHVRAPFRLIRAAAPYFRVKVRSSLLGPVVIVV